MTDAWVQRPLGNAPVEIIDGDRGTEYPKKSDFNAVGDWLFLDTGNVRKNGFDFTSCQFITNDKERKLRKGRVVRGDIVLTTRGTIGNVGWFNDRVRYDQIRINSGMVILRADRSTLLPEFLFLVVRSPQFRAQVTALTSGAAQPQLPIRDIRLLRIPLPPMSVQRHIASILGAYDDLIEVNRRRIAVLEEMARGLFEEWFVHFRFPEHKATEVRDKGDDRLPLGWTWTTLGALAEEMRDAVQPTQVSGETPYVGLEHIPRRSTTLDDWGSAADVTSTKLKFRRGDILFGKIRPYFHKVAWAPFEGICSSDAIVIRPRATKVAALVLAVTSSDRFVAHSVQTSNGTKMPRASWAVLAKYPVPMPVATVCDQFQKYVMAGVEMAATLQRSNTKLAASRALLLPRLMSGKLSVAGAERELEDAA
ncbi:MAG: restriction endonuclease subunit S [Hyphomicrobiaceae bacterium]